MSRNAVPIALVVFGVIGALYFAQQSIELFISGDFAGEQPILFAIACLVAVIGWNELRATDAHESDERGGF